VLKNVQSAIIAFILCRNSFPKWLAKPAIINFIAFAFTSGLLQATKPSVPVAAQSFGDCDMINK